MTIFYQILENPLREGEYFPRVVPQGTVPLSTAMEAIVRETGVSDVDVAAVLHALSKQVRLALLDGRNITIDGLGTFSLSLSEKLTSADAEVSEAVEVRVNLRPDPELVEAIRREATFERVVKPERAPIITSFRDVATGQENRYTAGNIGEIVGEDLSFNPAAADEGVFFVAADGTEVRAPTYAQVGTRKLVFLIPAGLNGEQTVEVRTRYSTDRLRSTRYRTAILPA